MSNVYPLLYNEPEEIRGRWKTYCNDCEWCDQYAHAYQSECDVDVCPECDSVDMVDINEEVDDL